MVKIKLITQSPVPSPQSPVPSPQSPVPSPHCNHKNHTLKDVVAICRNDDFT
ncbi:hypothetical protein H6F47_15330 [Sphaerospermopsis sp. FACHB-1094]|uniref:hypothetical protein n=1 Tax=Sphaerospermopsis sp. FACHB-1094 TaxID=2692861 RepID=UPI0016821FDC|nr:hypothetical protein [Sphaerospermopsis sp. FACHB-1094]MBD2133759.1 hypothetical protein [Sphaerospermopsis sp. FACHB-1094]